MSSCRSAKARWLLAAALGAATAVCLAQSANPAYPAYPGIGRTATPSELQAWDIDVRPDFKGLPKGSGSVAQGQVVWEAQCASCHGVFGENNQVFSPLVGGTTAADVKSGRVARLDDAGFPGRTTLMKLPTLSTLWDYIHRAMPWTAPKSLSADQVYAVTAYMLHLGGVLPDDFVLSDRTIAQAQQLLPNRNGMRTDHALWPGTPPGRGPQTRQPDVRAAACMKDCAPAARVASFMPDHARNNHGNLAGQQRGVGPQRGADTASARPTAAPLATADSDSAAAMALVQQHQCTTCHGIEGRVVGPGLREIAQRYAARADAQAYLAGRIKAGGQGAWGAIPMPAQTLSELDASIIALWLARGAGH